MKLDSIFKDSFDTFKVFDKLDIHQASLINNHSPKSLWQILNHLVVWQDYQLKKLNNEETKDINEVDTWYAETTITDQHLLNDTIAKFEKQLETIRAELRRITTEEKVKTVQDLTIHLSFHLGEVVLIMRQNGHYPMPNEMKSFLA